MMGFQVSLFRNHRLSGLALTCVAVLSSCIPRTAAQAPVVAEPPAPVRLIEVGERGQHQIQGGENHRFAFRANAGDYLQAVVTQQGLDVVVRILDPAGESIRGLSSRERRFGPEVAYVVTEVGGIHQIEVSPASPSAPPGTYALVLEEVHPASVDDLRRIDLDAGWFEPANDMFRFASQGEWDRMLDIYSDWKNVTEEFDSRDYKHRDFGTATVSLARALWNYDVDRDRALAMVSEGIESLKRSQGTNSFLVATTRRVLADMYLSLNMVDEARELLDAALAGMEAAEDTEPTEHALALRSLGQAHRLSRNFAEAIRFTSRSLEMLENEQASGLGTSLRPEQVVADTRFELGNTFRLAGNPRLARPLIESGITSVALDGAAPLIAFERFTVAAMLWLDLGEYWQLQRAADQAIAIAEGSAFETSLLSRVLTLSAEGHVLDGNTPAAVERYRGAIDAVRSGPSPYRASSLLGYIAGLMVDQGRFRDANSEYRAAFEEALAEPRGGNEYSIYEDWARLLRDTGMDDAADVLGNWMSGDRETPPLYPDSQALPVSNDRSGLTAGQILRRSGPPYRRDLRRLWRDLEMEDPETIGRCERCFISIVSENDSRTVIRVWTATGGHEHYLLLVPVQSGLRVVDALDLPLGQRSGEAIAVGSGDWLRIDAGTGRPWPHSHQEQWYAISPVDGFERRTPYPEVFSDRESHLAQRVANLHLPAWQIRQRGMLSIAALAGGLESDEALVEIVALLERETTLADTAFRNGTSPFLANGPAFVPYLDSIARLLLEAGDLNDPQTLGAIARSYYLADSGFSRELADRGGPGLIPVAMELITGDILRKRWNGISLLERLYEQRERHALDPEQASTIKATLVAACADSQISTQRLAIQALGRIGMQEDTPILINVLGTTDSESVREEARAAIAAIDSRGR